MCGRDAVFYVPIQVLGEETIEGIVCVVVMLSSMFQYDLLGKKPWKESYMWS